MVHTEDAAFAREIDWYRSLVDEIFGSLGEEARQVGANLVTYVLGSFQLGRFLSTTKVYYEEGEPSRDDFVFAQLKHEGDWDPDPSAVHNLLKHARDNSTLEVKFKGRSIADLLESTVEDVLEVHGA